MMRLRARLLAVPAFLSLLLLAALLFAPGLAAACQCGGGVDEAWAMRKAQTVFQGKVVKSLGSVLVCPADADPAHCPYTQPGFAVEVLEAYKGATAGQTVIVTHSVGHSCQIRLAVGDTLVFAGDRGTDGELPNMQECSVDTGEQAVTYLRGKLAERQSLEAKLQANPHDAASRVALVDYLIDLNQHDAADALLAAGLALSPDSLALQLAKAQRLLDTDKPDAALALLQAMPAADKEPLYLPLLSEAALRAGKLALLDGKKPIFDGLKGDVTLTDVDFSGAVFRNSQSLRLKLHNAKLADALFEAGRIFITCDNSDLSGVVFKRAGSADIYHDQTYLTLSGSRFGSCTLDHARFENVGITKTSFHKSSLKAANIRGQFREIDFRHADLQGAQIKPIQGHKEQTPVLREVSFARANLRGASFDQVIFDHVDLRGAVFGPDPQPISYQDVIWHDCDTDAPGETPLAQQISEGAWLAGPETCDDKAQAQDDLRIAASAMFAPYATPEGAALACLQKPDAACLTTLAAENIKIGSHARSNRYNWQWQNMGSAVLEAPEPAAKALLDAANGWQVNDFMSRGRDVLKAGLAHSLARPSKPAIPLAYDDAGWRFVWPPHTLREGEEREFPTLLRGMITAAEAGDMAEFEAKRRIIAMLAKRDAKVKLREDDVFNLPALGMPIPLERTPDIEANWRGQHYLAGRIFATQIARDLYQRDGKTGRVAALQQRLNSLTPAWDDNQRKAPVLFMLDRLCCSVATTLLGSGGADKDGTVKWQEIKSQSKATRPGLAVIEKMRAAAKQSPNGAANRLDAINKIENWLARCGADDTSALRLLDKAFIFHDISQQVFKPLQEGVELPCGAAADKAGVITKPLLATEGYNELLAAYQVFGLKQDMAVLLDEWRDHALGPHGRPNDRMFIARLRGANLSGAEKDKLARMMMADQVAQFHPDHQYLDPRYVVERYNMGILMLLAYQTGDDGLIDDILAAQDDPAAWFKLVGPVEIGDLREQVALLLSALQARDTVFAETLIADISHPMLKTVWQARQLRLAGQKASADQLAPLLEHAAKPPALPTNIGYDIWFVTDLEVAAALHEQGRSAAAKKLATRAASRRECRHATGLYDALQMISALRKAGLEAPPKDWFSYNENCEEAEITAFLSGEQAMQTRVAYLLGQHEIDGSPIWRIDIDGLLKAAILQSWLEGNR